MKINCINCGDEFDILIREYKRQIKRGRSEFCCSRSCGASKSNKNNPRPGNPQNLKSDNRRDEFTPFRWFVLRAQNRSKRKGYGCDLTVEFLKQLWDHQKQMCPFTGWTMILPQDTNGWKENHPTNASIDRIDNSKGYIKNNIRFVCLMANYARNQFSDEQLKDFCQAVINKVN